MDMWRINEKGKENNPTKLKTISSIPVKKLQFICLVIEFQHQTQILWKIFLYINFYVLLQFHIGCFLHQLRWMMLLFIHQLFFFLFVIFGLVTTYFFCLICLIWNLWPLQIVMIENLFLLHIVDTFDLLWCLESRYWFKFYDIWYYLQ